MTSEKLTAFRQLVAAANALQELRLWEKFENEDCFALKMPFDEHPLFGAIMGAGGEQYGLSFTRGQHG